MDTTITEAGRFVRRTPLDSDTLVAQLQSWHARKVDVVVKPVAATMRSIEGDISVRGVEPVVTDHGVTTVDGLYVPSSVAVADLAARYDIPGKYLRTLLADRPDLFDANVNGFMHGRKAKQKWVNSMPGESEPVVLREAIPGDERGVTLRLYAGQDGEKGWLRAIKSDRYRITHYLDNVLALLAGLRDAGLTGDDVLITGEVTESNLYLRVEAPSITAAAPTFLRDYRSPFGGQSGSDLPLIHSYLAFSDSEVGRGQLTMTGGAVVKVCSNGMTSNLSGFKVRHVGARMDEGIIDWQEDTQRANADLIEKMVRDAVSTYLTAPFVEEFAAQLEASAGKPVEGLEQAQRVVKHVGQRLRYTQEQQAGILDMFVRSGQHTAAGVTNAITAFAQVTDDVDEAKRLEATAFDALALV